MKENVEHSKLIATFMGLVKEDKRFSSGRSIEASPGTFTDYDALGQGFFKYHSSWDALMPVVKKISSIWGDWDYEDERREKAEDIFYMDNMFSEFLQNDVTAILVRCIEFINWYNELILNQYENNND